MPIVPRCLIDFAGKPADAPDWLNQEHLDACANNRELQERWQPKVGDWYFCMDLYKVMQIVELANYESERDSDSRGRQECDIYLPDPTRT